MAGLDGWTQRLTGTIPGWLAWPLSALSTLAAVAGAGLVLLAAASGSIVATVAAVITFLVSAACWYGSDYAQANRGPEVG